MSQPIPQQPIPTAEEDAQAVQTALVNFEQSVTASMAKHFQLGRYWWNRPEFCSDEYLCWLFDKAVKDGDMESIANYTVMLHARGVTDYRRGVIEYKINQLESVRDSLSAVFSNVNQMALKSRKDETLHPLLHNIVDEGDDTICALNRTISALREQMKLLPRSTTEHE